MERLDTPVFGTIAQALRARPEVVVEYTSADAAKGHVLSALEGGAHVLVLALQPVQPGHLLRAEADLWLGLLRQSFGIGFRGTGHRDHAFEVLLAFGTVVAAGLPLMMAYGGLIASIGVVALLMFAIDFNSFAETFMVMFGLALGIDYSLLFVRRFREERSKGGTDREVIERTLKTAGRTILFSGAIFRSAVLVIAFAPTAEATSDLVLTLRDDVPLRLELGACCLGGYDIEGLRAWYERCGLPRLAERLVEARPTKENKPTQGHFKKSGHDQQKPSHEVFVHGRPRSSPD